MNFKMDKIYLIWIMLIIGSSILFFILYKFSAPKEKEEKKFFLLKYSIIGLLFVIFSFIEETIGVKAGLWYNKTSLYEFGKFRVSIEEIPLEFFAGIFWLLMYHKFETNEQRFLFFITSVGAVCYMIALAVHFGFLIHAKWYNIGWSFPYWVINLGFLLLLDWLLSKKYQRKQ